MSVFGEIKAAIFGHAAAQAPAADAAATAPAPAAPTAPASPEAAPTPAEAPAPAAPETIDVDTVLTDLAEKKGEQDLQWQTSIVDLMKLTGMDASLANREELATELGYTGEKDGSAEMNEWLHTAVMNKLRNG